MDKKNNGISLFAKSDVMVNDDPLEEIFALNLGDFLSEHLISQDLAQKISSRDKCTGLKNQLKELVSIYSLKNTLCVLSFDKTEEYTIYTSIAQSIKQMLDVEFCEVYLEKEGKPVPVSGSEEHAAAAEKAAATRAQQAQTAAEARQAASEVTALVGPQAAEAFGKREIVREGEIVAIPMLSSVKTAGVIVIPRPDREEYLVLAQSIASLFATSFALQSTIDEANKLIASDEAVAADLQHIRAEMTALIGDLCNYQQSFTEHLALAVDAKGQYKVAHSKNTAELARKICKELELNEKTSDLIYYAGLLQNIGKIALPERIFATSGKLSADELCQIRESANTGVNLLMNINFMSEVVPYIVYSSERFDGSGKPEGLKSNSIPLGSRIIAAADAFSALTSERPHRPALPQDKALEILKEEAGKNWDPVVVEALYRTV